MKKHFLIYIQFMKNCLMQQMEYRANFFIHVTVECMFLLSKLLYVLITYQVGSDINGISADEMILYMGTFLILTAIYTGFFMDNFYAISEKVKRGELDLLVTKPISTLFYVTMRKVNLALPVPNIIVGTIMVCMGWRRLGITVSVSNILLYLGFILLCSMLAYAVFLLPQILSFWIVKTSSVVEISDKLWDFNNMPMTIYSKWVKRIGTFVIPVFCITNFPVMAVLKSLSTIQLIWAIAAPVVLFFLVLGIWRFSLEHYSSAGG